VENKRQYIDDNWDNILDIVLLKGVSEAAKQLGVTRDHLYSRLLAKEGKRCFWKVVEDRTGKIKLSRLGKKIGISNTALLRERVHNMEFYDPVYDCVPLENIDDVIKEVWIHCNEDRINDESIKRKVREAGKGWVRVKECIYTLEGILPFTNVWKIVKDNKIPMKFGRGSWWFYLPPNGDPFMILRYADYKKGKLKPYITLAKVYAEKIESGEAPDYEGSLCEIRNGLLNEYW